ncbi:DUF4349 domain-containing protein [Nonomuraea typhae]|uniref:DUF4349 domain-containing protein n=1 Tax=Nonomuraea typhae TaxID=2603600 RepID=UPI0012FA77D1|nr:DUF4349 domain-containing protein [Nonomuraea typhae]
MKRMALTAAAAAVLLAGCAGGGQTSSMSPVSESAGGSAAAPQAETARPMSSHSAKGQAYDTDSGDDSGDRTITSDVKVTQQDRQIIYTGSMTVRAQDVPRAADQAKTIVTGAGGHVSKEDSSSADQQEARATLEFKIPPARYQEVLTALGRDLGRRLSMSQGTQDVTVEVADVNSRLKSAEGALASLRTLLGKATKIGEVLQVEREIQNREAELESLQARQKELSSQVSMATLTLQLVGPVATVLPPDDEPPGFLGGLAAGWRALLDFLKLTVTVIGAVLPWMIIVLPVVALLIWLVRRGRTRSQVVTVTATEEVSP